MIIDEFNNDKNTELQSPSRELVGIMDKFNNGKKIEANSPSRVLGGIAVSALEPQNQFSYSSGSCYNQVASALAKGHVRDTDQIVLVGLQGNVHHAFVARDGKPFIDSMANYGAFDQEKGVYFLGATYSGVKFEVISTLSYSVFKQRLPASELNVDEGAEYPESQESQETLSP